ncbi:MAG: ParA family protein [Alphaproteobacteria bacterium]|nr:ParA family protein [Alphaproteobacteria bacterium]
MTAKIITISQQKGGSGKSTIATHLAVALWQRNSKVVIIDIDPQGSSTMWYHIREREYGAGYCGIKFASCSGIRISSEIGRLKLTNDFIIIDCPPHTDTDAKAAIRASDLVLVPMQPSPTDLWATHSTLEYTKEVGKNAKILLNRYVPSSKILKNLNVPGEYLLETTIGNRVGFASSMNIGKTILEAEPLSPGAKEIGALASEILTLLKVRIAA